MKSEVEVKGVEAGRRAASVDLNWERSLVQDFVYCKKWGGGGGKFNVQSSKFNGGEGSNKEWCLECEHFSSAMILDARALAKRFPVTTCVLRGRKISAAVGNNR